MAMTVKYIYPSVKLLKELADSIEFYEVPDTIDSATLRAQIIMAISKAYEEILYCDTLTDFFENTQVRESIMFRLQRMEYIIEGFTEEDGVLFAAADELCKTIRIEAPSPKRVRQIESLIKASIFAAMTDIFDEKTLSGFCAKKSRNNIERWVF